MSHSIHMLSIQIDTQKPLIGYSLLVEQHQFFSSRMKWSFLDGVWLLGTIELT